MYDLCRISMAEKLKEELRKFFKKKQKDDENIRKNRLRYQIILNLAILKNLI